MDMSKIYILLSLFVTFTSAMTTSVNDFCIADFNYPKGPAGYVCKNPSNVTVDDFVFTGFRVPGDRDEIFKVARSFAIDETFPGLNAMNLGMVRLDVDVDGVISIHSHRVSEVEIVVQGTIIGGFISSNDVAYYKVLQEGDVMVFPQGLLHFQINIGEKPALVFAILNSANPGFQTTTQSLFGNDLPTEIIQKLTLLDPDQIQKLKRIFGGQGIATS